MDFEYTGRHIDVTPALRAHVEEHFGKIGHLFENASTARAHVIIDVVKNRHIAEILLHWREHTLTARDTNADMYQALTRCIDKIEKQAVRSRRRSSSAGRARRRSRRSRSRPSPSPRTTGARPSRPSARPGASSPPGATR